MSGALPEFVYTLRPKRVDMLLSGPSPEEAETLRDHVSYLERLAEEGRVLLAGRTQTEDESTFGIVLITAASEADANDIMTNDPAIRGGIMAGQLFPYRIAVVSPTILTNRSA